MGVREPVKRVGIVTIVGRSNYGNRLQNYALVKVWQEFGYIAETIKLPNRRTPQRMAKDFVLKLLGKPTSDPESSSSQNRLANFDKFDLLVNLKNVSSLEEIHPDEFSYFSVGSDQVWNPGVFNGREELFFLKFAESNQKIALAPSMACESLSSEQAKSLLDGLSGFPNLSVREQRGAELIKQYTGLNAKVICDPTLVLSADEWRLVASGQLTPKKPYVFTYLLGGISSEAAEVLDKVTDHGRLAVVALSDRQNPGEIDAGPAEFIDLIDNAAHVVTDSFHAAVFSSILESPLTIVHRPGGASMFSRLEQLSQMLDISEKVYGSPSYDISLAGNYEGVREMIDCAREKFLEYLRGCLNG